ncbi:MAG: DUF2459 domain-containing protein [Phycisphaerales bacterium]|nr:MAG: DUF2459 domain-containing protein [Phycisphaerales bacterium]
MPPRTRARRVTAARTGLLLLLMIVALCSTGCSTTIIPPADPSQPASVFIIDYGRHTSLMLPQTDDQSLIEYAYGEWDWFALDRSRWYHLFPTLLWPTRGTLGRWEWDMEPDVETLRHRIWCQNVLEVTVDSASIADLLVRLDERYRRHPDTLHYQPLYQLNFVHDDQRYWAFHNCNHVLAQWLRDLDCKVHGFAMFADFRVRQVGTRAQNQ